jgi:hypothetical protein
LLFPVYPDLGPNPDKAELKIIEYLTRERFREMFNPPLRSPSVAMQSVQPA